MSSTWTNAFRFASAASLGLAACLIAWWPQSAAGSGGTDLSPVVAAPTQNTPTPGPPTPTVAPPPPTSAPPAPQPTHEPTHKATTRPTHKPATLHNNGTSQPSGHHTTSSSHHTSPPPASTGSGSTSAPYVAPTHSAAPPMTTPTPTESPSSTPAQSATTAPTPSTPTQSAAAPVVQSDDADRVDQTAGGYDTYLSGSEPVQATSAPVWVVPGILLILTAMLALLGGVLGRGNRSAVAPVRTSEGDALAVDRV